jgi:hypothetical protein
VAAAEEIFDGIEEELAARVGGGSMQQLRAVLEPLHTALLEELVQGGSPPGRRGADPAR